MKSDVYKKMLEDRIENMKIALDHIENKLISGECDYPEYLFIENNIFTSLIKTQHELNDLERKAV